MALKSKGSEESRGAGLGLWRRFASRNQNAVFLGTRDLEEGKAPEAKFWDEVARINESIKLGVVGSLEVERDLGLSLNILAVRSRVERSTKIVEGILDEEGNVVPGMERFDRFVSAS
jgi:hypothetical protein